MRDTGYRTRDGRRVVHLTGPLLPPGGLYRVAYGNGGPSVLDEDIACEWDGEQPGRLYAYFDTFDEACRNGDLEGSPGVYCSLHCWGQQHGYTDL